MRIFVRGRSHGHVRRRSVRLALILIHLLGSACAMVKAQDQDARPRPHLPLELLPDTLAICRLAPSAALPEWADGPKPFLTVSRTAEELSITTVASVVPDDVRCERNYRMLRVRGPLPLNLVGILAAIADPLAEAGLSIFAISTFDTDYVLVKAEDLPTAIETLERAGHRIKR
jgi:hypothetical protein